MAPRSEPRWRALGWLSLPLIGVLALAATRVRPGLSSVLPDLTVGPLLAGRGTGWSFWLGALTLGLALAAVGNLILRAVGERHPFRRFLLLWAGSLAAALLITGAIAAGELLARSAGGAPGPGLVGFVLARAALVALRWAALAGLAGAGITAGLGPHRPVAAPGAPFYLRAAVAGALGLGAVLAAGSVTALVATENSTVPRASVPAPAASSPTPSGEPSDPALLTNPEPARPYPGRCRATALEVSYRFADAAAGTRYGVLTLRNTSTSTCTVKGYPDLAFADVLGNNVRVKYVHGRWSGRQAKVLPVRLAPGASARAELSWRGDAGAYDREVDTVLAAPWAGARRTECPDRFDVKNGSTMRVSPWLPTK